MQPFVINRRTDLIGGYKRGEHCMFSHCIPLGQFAISSWFGDDITKEAFAAFGEE